LRPQRAHRRPDIGWPTRINDGLTCKVFTVDGRQRVDGIDAIKMAMRGGIGRCGQSRRPYLLVRIIIDLGGAPEQTDFRWLPPTRASLAELQVTIPAGFTQVPPPRG
jgi:hypothetical protein